MKSTKRSMIRWREKGYKVAKVENREPFSGKTRDMFGFADLLCLKATGPLVAVQTTTKAEISRHLLKYRRDADVRETILWWLATGSHFVVEGWHQPRGKGGKWICDIRDIVPADLELTEKDKSGIAKS